MKIEKNKVVLMHYRLKNDSGEQLDSSFGNEPMGFIYGNGMIISGLEHILVEKSKGDKFTTIIPPEDGYGLKNDDLIQDVSLSQFENKDDVKVGLQFEVNGTNPALATVVEINGDTVTLDLNHPLAGVELYFDIEIVDVRDATPEELDHGHVHGVGGHHH